MAAFQIFFEGLNYRIPVKVLAELNKLASTFSRKFEDEQTAYFL